MNWQLSAAEQTKELINILITLPNFLRSTVPNALLMQCNAGPNKSWNVPHKNSAGLMIRVSAK